MQVRYTRSIQEERKMTREEYEELMQMLREILRCLERIEG